MTPTGISATEAADNLTRVFANAPGTCAVAEFEADPDRYLAEWMGGTMGFYVASRLGNNFAHL